jgi:hypothetical protein
MSAEVVHIFILLVYALMTQKFGIRSWTLWAVSLAVELTRLGIHSDAIVLNIGPRKFISSYMLRGTRLDGFSSLLLPN